MIYPVPAAQYDQYYRQTLAPCNGQQVIRLDLWHGEHGATLLRGCTYNLTPIVCNIRSADGYPCTNKTTNGIGKSAPT